MVRFTLLSLSLVLVMATAPVSAEDEGFTPLFNGKDMSGFSFLLKGEGDPQETWSVKEGVIYCMGKPNGYFYTKKSYSNYVLKFDFRYPENAGNSGYLIHIDGEHKVWPKCVEVQGMFRDVGKIFAIGGAKGPQSPKSNEELHKILEEIRKPHQEWNTLEITVQDGKISSQLNGKPVGEGQYDLKAGPIGFQSEGAPIEFRNMQIKEMK